jgi:excisionase family DNA binding protein
VPDDEKFFTTQEVAELLRVTVRTLERWRAAGKGPALITMGGLIRYRHSDLDAWIEANRSTGEGR